jgi:uncharacterized membrane protein YdjX (TVP38/TMEM64 family)
MKLNKKIVLALILFAIPVFAYMLGITNILTLESLQVYKKRLLAFVQAHYTLSVLIYMVTYILITGLSLPGASTLTIAGGFLFGVFPGVVYVIGAATIGALLAFLLVRYLIGESIQKKYHKKFITFYHELQKQGGYYLLFLRLIPLMPFFLINILAALTPISFWTFTLATAFGIIPGSLIYTYAGYHLRTASSFQDIFSPRLFLIGGYIAFMAILAVYIARQRRHT